MNSETYVLGVDIGTTSTKAIVFDEEGQVMGKHAVEYPLYAPAPGYAEQEPEEIFQAVLQAISIALRRARVDAQRILCVSFSSAMHSLIAVDREGKPLTRSITWADTRSTLYAKEINEHLHGREIYLRTGTPVHPMAPLAKIRWLVHERPEIVERTHKFLSIKEYVFHKLFGEYLVDYSIASATGLFNLQKLAWDEQALRAAGITQDMLSAPHPTTYGVKGLKKAYAERLGLSPDVLFVLGASDGVLANLGVYAIDPGVMAATIGTSGAVRVTVDRPLTDPRGRTFCYALTDKMWVIGGAINNGGIAYRWLRDELGAAEAETAKRLGRDPYDLLSEIAARVAPGADGLLFLPFLTGERAPYWNADARGVFFGLSLRHKKEHLIRAVLEGVVYALRSVVDALEELAGETKEVKATGGFARSPLWRQIMADVFGREVSVPQSHESSSLGAAVLGWLATGRIASLSEVREMVGSEFRHVPVTENTERYGRLYAIYERLYDRLREEFSQIAAYQQTLS